MCYSEQLTHKSCVQLLQGLASKQHDVTADHMIALLAMRDDMSKSKVKQVTCVYIVSYNAAMHGALPDIASCMHVSKV